MNDTMSLAIGLATGINVNGSAMGTAGALIGQSNQAAQAWQQVIAQQPSVLQQKTDTARIIAFPMILLVLFLIVVWIRSRF